MPNKLILLLLVVCMLLYLSACDITKTGSNVNNTPSESQTNTVQNTDESSQTKLDDTTNQLHTHSYSDATCTLPKKCSCGVTAGTALGHQFSSATCTSPQICSRCGTQNGNALGHSYFDATCTLPKTCTRCGQTSGGALGHNYVNDKCSRCGKVDPESLPVSLNDVPLISSNPSNWYSYNYGTIKDSYGNTYNGYHKMSANGMLTLEVDYNLNRKYRSFSCDLVAPQDMQEGKLDIQFYVDDKLVYYVDDYTNVTGLIHIDFNVYEGQRLTIKVTKTEGGLKGHGREVLLVNAQLNK